MPSNVSAPASFPNWRIDPYTVDSRTRATAEEADGLGNQDGRVSKNEIELLAGKYEDKGHTSSASVVRGEWDKLSSEGVSNAVYAAPGAAMRGAVDLIQLGLDALFSNVR